VCAAFSSTCRCGWSGGSGTSIRTGSRAIRLGGAALISFVTLADMPRRSIPCRSATIPMIVMMHAGSAAATRSVGENRSPFPWLSVGASVSMTEPEGPCVSVQRSWPS
jgi:hypothetical protein